jgi:hypothetical protein
MEKTSYTRFMLKAGLFSLSLFLMGTSAAQAHLQIACSDPSNLKSVQPEYEKTLKQALDEAGYKGVTIKCTSCYRNVIQQANACRRVCGNPQGCPGRCARPGSSQHQKKQIATCDLSGLSQKGGVRGGCDFLAKLCNEKFGGKCGVGGYPGGSHHFGAGDDKPSAWNQCAYVKAKLGINVSQGQRTYDMLNTLRQRVYHRQRGGGEDPNDLD